MYLLFYFTGPGRKLTNYITMEKKKKKIMQIENLRFIFAPRIFWTFRFSRERDKKRKKSLFLSQFPFVSLPLCSWLY